MAKKKTGNATKSTAKAAKKAKAAQKVERREKKKVSKSKNDSDDEEDLEGILENVSPCAGPQLTDKLIGAYSVDAERMGRGPHSHGRVGRRPSQQTRQCYTDRLSKRKSPMVHRGRILQ
jgi:hypothetical protein